MNKKILMYTIPLAVIAVALLLYYQPPKSNTETCKHLTKEQATELVVNQPMVKSFLERMSDQDQKTVIRTPESDDEKSYSVQVAESHPDHLATYNWYEVDACTGVVTAVFNR